MATDFQDYFLGMPIGWLVGNPNGRAYFKAIGQVFDDDADHLRQATKASFPELAPTDSLHGPLASEYAILQGPTETDDHYAQRLRSARTGSWPYAGMALGVLVQLYWQGLTNAVVVQQNGLAYYLSGAPDLTDPKPQLVSAGIGIYSGLPGDPHWWVFDTNNKLCNRWMIVLPSVPAVWTSPVSPPTTSSSPSINDIARIYSIAQTWGPAKGNFQGIVLTTAGQTWGWPADNWGDSPAWASSSTTLIF